MRAANRASAPAEPYLAYVCGARTAQYDVEDVLAMLDAACARGPTATSGWSCVLTRRAPARRTKRCCRTACCWTARPISTDADTRPEAVDVRAIRHMASFLSEARFVVSSWGTTALLEACIFDTRQRAAPLDGRAAPRARRARSTGARLPALHPHAAPSTPPARGRTATTPTELNAVLAELEARREEYSRRRAEAVARLTCLPLGGVVDRVCDALRPVVSSRPAREPQPAG